MRKFIKKMVMMAVMALAMLFGFTPSVMAQARFLQPHVSLWQNEMASCRLRYRKISGGRQYPRLSIPMVWSLPRKNPLTMLCL